MLQIKNLTIEVYDHEFPETIVNEINFQIEKGEIVGLVGESGSGKTMTALAIAGLLKRRQMKCKGEILFERKDLLSCTRGELREYQGNDISMIFQEPMTSLNPVKKVGWQVEESLKLHTTLKKEERYKKTIDMLQKVELENPEKIYHSYPHQLSGGMRQRVMIASAMICEPKLLIADEPTTALDVTIQAQIMELLKKINRKQQTSILFISHDLSLVKDFCDQVIVMQEGSIVEAGTANEIFYQPKHEYTKELIAAIPVIEL